MIRKWFWSLLLALMLAAALQGQSRESVLKALAQTANWAPADKPTEYDERTIEDLVGRRAPAIVRYGINGATREAWKGPEGSFASRFTKWWILVRPMAGSLSSAISVSLDLLPCRLALRVFASATDRGSGNRSTSSGLEGSEAATQSAARVISENIFGRSRKPPVSRVCLPPTNLVDGSDKYIVEGSGVGPRFRAEPRGIRIR